MDTLLRDLRDAVRSLAGRPGLSLAAVITMALGIAGTTVLMAAAGAMLRPADAPAGTRLVRVFAADVDSPYGIGSFANFTDVAARVRTLKSLAIHQQTFAAYGLGDDSTSVAVELVSEQYFPLLGVTAARGRVPSADESSARVVVISDRWWRTHLAADPNVVGSVLHLNGTPFTIVGIAPPGFSGAYATLGTDLWAPLMTYDVVRPRGLDIHRRGWGWLQATAALAPEATLTQAQAELDTIAGALRQAYPRENASLAFTVVTASRVPESMIAPLRQALAVAMIVALLALVAACANVANASLAALTSRTTEIAVRMALGASSRAIARQWLIESLVVSALATGAGLLLAVWLRDAIVALPAPADAENLRLDLRLDWLAWAAAASLLTLATCLSGAWPAYRASRVAPAQPLRDGATANVGGGGSWMRPALVSAQAAVALTLVALAAMLGQSLATARWFDVGFDRRNLVVARANVSALGHDDAQSYAYHADVMTRLRALPGVEAVTAASVVPLGTNDERQGIRIDGYTPPNGDPVLGLATNVVWPGYFEMMRIPILGGRSFVDDDGRQNARPVAIVNETMARRYWPDGAAVGKTIRLDEQAIAVVGIVKDITYYAIGEAPLPYLYLSFGPNRPYHDGLTFHVRSSLAPAVMARQMTRELRAPDPRVRVVNAMAYEALRSAALLPTRAIGWLSAGFGLMALALFLVGTYGVTAFAVGARRRELALRLALGASPEALRAAVVRRAVSWSVPGAVVGVSVAAGLGQLLRGFLVGVSATDPAALAVALASVIGASALAAWIPARRACRGDLPAELRR